MEKRIVRSRMQVMAEILSICNTPQPKTRISDKTNLSDGILLHYLTMLQELGLLEVHHSQTKCKTTQKGLRFLRQLKELVEV